MKPKRRFFYFLYSKEDESKVQTKTSWWGLCFAGIIIFTIVALWAIKYFKLIGG